MAESKGIVRCPSSSSPPPNCAICLGAFSNKCFSDSCMHQFCFKCLLEWSKIKAECPLCKQPFTRIIHNVKSNVEYDEHVVEITQPEEVHIIDNEEYLFLPLGQPQSTRHHFHFRTTFTVDTHGEHAIQQMLLTHPHISVSTSGYAPQRRRREPATTTNFRRSIYIRNLWVIAPPDVTGRYRDVSPLFFRNFPGARTRLVPWLNRELNAILYENTQLVMRLVDVIMNHLLYHHICSRTFRNLLFEYLDNKTDHFIHEFFNFMRSPFDMIGYDRHVIYSERPQSPQVFTLPDDVFDEGNDSDVIILGTTTQEPVIIDLVESDSDEPILVPDDPPAPDLIPIPDNSPEPERDVRTPILPLKLRLKHKRRSREEEREKRYRKRSRRYRSSSSSSDSSWKSSGRHRRKKKVRRIKRRRHSSTESDDNYSSDSDSDSPLSLVVNKRKASKNSINIKDATKDPDDDDLPTNLNLPSCSKNTPEIEDRFNYKNIGLKEEPPSNSDAPTCSKYTYTPPDDVINCNESSDEEYVPRPQVKSEIKKISEQSGRSSRSNERLRNITIKKGNTNNTWYTCKKENDSSDNEADVKLEI